MSSLPSEFTDVQLPPALFEMATRVGSKLSEHVLWIRIADQRMLHFARETGSDEYRPVHEPYIVSTSKFGIGQQEGSKKTPLGLHRIAEKFGKDAPRGTIFKGRRPIGNVNDGDTNAMITDRILWLDGLEPGFNRGGDVDSYNRYIYIHGTGDQSTIGKPHSQGCTHMATDDLIPLFDIVPIDTLVFITET